MSPHQGRLDLAIGQRDSIPLTEFRFLVFRPIICVAVVFCTKNNHVVCTGVPVNLIANPLMSIVFAYPNAVTRDNRCRSCIRGVLIEREFSQVECVSFGVHRETTSGCSVDDEGIVSCGACNANHPGNPGQVGLVRDGSRLDASRQCVKSV